MILTVTINVTKFKIMNTIRTIFYTSIVGIFIMIFSSSCSVNHQYAHVSKEIEKLNKEVNYHSNQSNDAIDFNKKHKDVNKKYAEKRKHEEEEKLKSLNAKSKKVVKQRNHSTHNFSFY